MTVSNVADLEMLGKLEDGIGGLEPVVRELNWVSFSDGKAIYEFDTGAKPKDAAELLNQNGLPGLKVAKVKSTRSMLKFSVSD